MALLFCFIASDKALCQTTSAQRSPAALPPDLIELRNAGAAALYNLDYASARAKFTELCEQLPQHPVGELNLAVLTWIEYLDKTRRLQTSLYGQTGFYAGGTDAKAGDVIDPEVDRSFRQYIAQAQTKAQTLLNRLPNDPDALYFLGAVYGVLAGYEASAARKFMGALRNGSRCRELHQRVIKLRPDYYDAFLSIGLYHYVVGSLPAFVRFLVAIGGIHGDKEQGIRELHLVVEKGLYNGDDAAVMLLAAYQREGRPQDAVSLLQELNAKYPKNYLLRLELASTLSRLQHANEAYAIFEELLRANTRQAEDLTRYQYSEALFANRDYQRAAEQFLAVTKTPGAEASLVTYALLRAGQAYDLAGQRPQALEQYRQVLARPNVYDSRGQAIRWLKKPFKEN